MFTTKNDFSLHIEEIKKEFEFETYMEAVIYFYENETDHEIEDISKMLNKKILDNIMLEAMQSGMMKENDIVQIEVE